MSWRPQEMKAKRREDLPHGKAGAALALVLLCAWIAIWVIAG